MSERDLLIAVREESQQIREDVSEIKVAVFGDNGEDKPGLKMRVDRLEQRSKLWAYVLSAVTVAVIGVVVERVFSHATEPRQSPAAPSNPSH